MVASSGADRIEMHNCVISGQCSIPKQCLILRISNEQGPFGSSDWLVLKDWQAVDSIILLMDVVAKDWRRYSNWPF